MSGKLSFSRLLNEYGVAASSLDGIFEVPEEMSFVHELLKKRSISQAKPKVSPMMEKFKNCFWCGDGQHLLSNKGRMVINYTKVIKSNTGKMDTTYCPKYVLVFFKLHPGSAVIPTVGEGTRVKNGKGTVKGNRPTHDLYRMLKNMFLEGFEDTEKKHIHNFFRVKHNERFGCMLMALVPDKKKVTLEPLIGGCFSVNALGTWVKYLCE